jgi:hypothetical protein
MNIFILFFFSFLTWAKFDLATGIQARSLPMIGGEIYAESGFNQLLWGTKKTTQDFKYGLIRPSLGVSTSAVINSAKAELEFFPISFLGIAVGRQYLHSNFDFPFFDCEEVTCQGEFIRNFVETKLALAHKGWIALTNYKVDTLRSPQKDRPQGDWRNVILGDPGTEVQHEKKLLIGKMFSQHMVGILAEHAQFEGSKEAKEGFTAVYQLRRENTSYMFGLGSFRTSQQGQGVILYFRLHHLLIPSLKLF